MMLYPEGDAEMHCCHKKTAYIIKLFLPILVMAILWTGCVTRPADFGPGLMKFDSRQYDKATLVFQEIADKDGEKASRAMFYMGECYRYQSRYDRAIEQFQMVVDAEPSRSYLANQARDRILQIREGRRDTARIKIIHDNNPGTDMAADALLELGSIYETKLGDYENAIKTYRQVVDEFPGTEKAAQAQINIGNICFYRLYDYTRGWPEFRKVNAENYPDMPRRIAEVEELLRETNRLRQEISSNMSIIREAQKRRVVPGDGKATGYDVYGIMRNYFAEAYMAIAKAWKQLRNYPKALEVYRTFVEQFPLMLAEASESRYGIGEIYQEWGRYLEAVDAYEAYIEFHPTHYRTLEAVYNAATCYEIMEDYEKAYEKYKKYYDTSSYPSRPLLKDAALLHDVRLNLRKYEADRDRDGFPYYMELMSGTSDNDPNEYPQLK
ncbi:tetratricopeptide repeat protein [Candidatus Poribacteria bacterium]